MFPNSNDPEAAFPPNSPPEESVSQIEFDDVRNRFVFEEFV